MITGSDIRRYRKAVRQTQADFAGTMGISQAALSLIEQGRTAVSAEHVAALKERFVAPRFGPTFAEFAGGVEREKADHQAALESPGVRYLTLTVWRWEEGFDLGRTLTPDQAAGVITIEATGAPAIALKMPRKSSQWEAGEIFVFKRCRIEDVRDGEICLVQVRATRGDSTRTHVAVAHLAPAKRGRALQFEPISPAGPFVPADSDRVLGVLRSVFRGHYFRD